MKGDKEDNGYFSLATLFPKVDIDKLKDGTLKYMRDVETRYDYSNRAKMKLHGGWGEEYYTNLYCLSYFSYHMDHFGHNLKNSIDAIDIASAGFIFSHGYRTFLEYYKPNDCLKRPRKFKFLALDKESSSVSLAKYTYQDMGVFDDDFRYEQKEIDNSYGFLKEEYGMEKVDFASILNCGYFTLKALTRALPSLGSIMAEDGILLMVYDDIGSFQEAARTLSPYFEIEFSQRSQLLPPNNKLILGYDWRTVIMAKPKKQ